MKPLRIALTKGRLEKSTVELFEQIGLDCSCLRDKGRKLILPVGDGELEAVLAKAPDVITYVEHGVCDLGVVGKDTIMEHGSHFFEILDLGFGRCGFALAAPRGVETAILFGIREMAAIISPAVVIGKTDAEVNEFFYKALCMISYGMSKEDLLPVVQELGEMKQKCRRLLGQV